VYLLERDCILFKANKKINFESYQFSTPYEKLNIEESNQGYTKIIYTWLDPVRVREKIIAKDQRSVILIYFYKKDILSCFGSSESLIGYVINKMEKVFKVGLEKVKIFDNFNDAISAELINIHLFMGEGYGEGLYEDEHTVKLNIKDIPRSVLQSYFNKNQVTSLTFKNIESNNRINYFYVDNGSVVSFPDTMKEDVVYNVLEKVFHIS